MAGGHDVEEAGKVVACPICATEVKEHSMIPVMAEPATGAADAEGEVAVAPVVRLVCVACARRAVVKQPG